MRSYGIYLWHWPVYMVTRPHLDVPITGLPLLVLRVALTLVLADLSFRYVEEPIRHGAIGRRFTALAHARGRASPAHGHRSRRLGRGDHPRVW